MAGAIPNVGSRGLLLASGIVAVLIAPMVLTGSTFGGDWPGHLWLVEMQARNIEYLGHPSLFVQSTFGAFEPWYAFYGGTLYALVGAGAVLIGGHVLVAYVASFALAIAMAYGGCAWIARQAGVRGWAAHLCGLVFVTSAYYLADVYARGAWPETVATSALPLVVAAGIALLRAERWRVGPASAFVLGVVVFTGSHNITLLYGTTFLALLGIAVLASFGRSVLPSSRRAAQVAGLGLLAAGVNLWFLLPDVAFQGHTSISHSFTGRPTIEGGTAPGLILDPFRHSGVRGYPTLDLQVPTLALLWSIAVIAAYWRTLPVGWRRMSVALALVSLPYFALLFIPDLWDAVPRIYWAIQFPYRLLSYLDYCAVGLVAVALIAIRGRARTTTRTALVVIGVLFAVIEVGQAINQQWSAPSSLHSRAEAFPGGNRLPAYWDRFASYLEFQDVSMPVVSATIPEIPGLTFYNGQGANVIPVPVTVPKSSYSVTFTPPKDGTVNTDIVTGPYLVAVHGAKFVGRTPYSELIMRVRRRSAGPTTVTFTTANSWPIVLGKWGTCVSLVAILGVLAMLTIGRFRRVPAGSSPASPRPPRPS
jgi:hypothetical protein